MWKAHHNDNLCTCAGDSVYTNTPWGNVQFTKAYSSTRQLGLATSVLNTCQGTLRYLQSLHIHTCTHCTYSVFVCWHSSVVCWLHRFWTVHIPSANLYMKSTYSLYPWSISPRDKARQGKRGIFFQRKSCLIQYTVYTNMYMNLQLYQDTKHVHVCITNTRV